MVLIGEKLNQLRKSAGYTEQEVADILGVSSVTISSYERDMRKPSYENLIKIAGLYHVTLDYLLWDKKTIDVEGLSKDEFMVIQGLIQCIKSGREKSVNQQIKCNNAKVMIRVKNGTKVVIDSTLIF